MFTTENNLLSPNNESMRIKFSDLCFLRKLSMIGGRLGLRDKLLELT
jgi:hypothetical protein